MDGQKKQFDYVRFKRKYLYTNRIYVVSRRWILLARAIFYSLCFTLRRRDPFWRYMKVHIKNNYYNYITSNRVYDTISPFSKAPNPKEPLEHTDAQ